eukprot:TRINITY_DN4511_c0_g1_i1.p1 TRINITY_DN4511_c0_g1~~TRINITY_DN4511_c0_g1_i1.p1  ORF type:complete len:1260 (-),score=253.85 TRINITY_DN4511_c0_g1_i1:30-3809(-)
MGEAGLYRATDFKAFSFEGSIIAATLFNTCAKVVLTLAYHFSSKSDEPIDAVFCLPIHPNAQLCGIDVLTDKKVLPGSAQSAAPKQELTLTAEQEALLKSHKGSPYNVLRVPISGLSASTQTHIRIAYVIELEGNVEGDITFTLPAQYFSSSVAKKDPKDKGDLSGTFMNVEVFMRNGIEHIKALCDHTIQIKPNKGGCSNVTLSKLPKSGSDFVLAIQLKDHDPYFDIEMPTKSSVRGEKDETENTEPDMLAGLLSFFPRLPAKTQNTEIVFLVDRSLSMNNNDRIALSNAVISCALPLLPEESYFQMIYFGGGSEQICFDKGSVEASAKNKAKALKTIPQSGSGGSQLLGTLTSVLHQPVVPGCSRTLMLVTDGELTNLDMIAILPILRKQTSRCFVIGVAPGPCSYTLFGLARVGCGRAAIIPGGLSPKHPAFVNAVTRQTRRAISASLNDLRLEWGFGSSSNVPAIQTIPKVLPPVFSDDAYRVYAMWPRHEGGSLMVPTEIQLTGVSSEGTEVTIKVAIADKPGSETVGCDLLHKLAIAGCIQQFRELEQITGLQITANSSVKHEMLSDILQLEEGKRLSKSDLVQIATRASLADDVLGTSLFVSSADDSLMQLDILDPIKTYPRTPAATALSGRTSLGAKRPVPKLGEASKAAAGSGAPVEDLRKKRLLAHAKMMEQFSPGKVSASAAVPPVLYNEIEGLALTIAAREVAKHHNNGTNCLTSDMAKIVYRIVQTVMQTILAKLEFALVKESPDQSQALRVVTDSAAVEPLVVAAIAEAMKNTQAPSVSICEEPRPYKLIFHSETGTRQTNEDMFVVVEHVNEFFGRNDRENWVYIGLYDGHSGLSAAEYATQQLHVNILRKLQDDNLDKALLDGFAETDRLFNERAIRHGLKSGTTAMSVFFSLTTGRIVVANCGDAKAILCSKPGKPVEGQEEVKTICHIQHPDRPDEKVRIEKAGGKVILHGTYRVNGHIAVSRSIGDPHLANLVVAVPEMYETQVDLEHHEFALFATDGLWDVMSEQEAMVAVRDAVREHGQAEAARVVCELAVAKKSSDNVTVLIIFFSGQGSFRSIPRSSDTPSVPKHKKKKKEKGSSHHTTTTTTNNNSNNSKENKDNKKHKKKEAAANSDGSLPSAKTTLFSSSTSLDSVPVARSNSDSADMHNSDDPTHQHQPPHKKKKKKAAKKDKKDKDKKDKKDKSKLAAATAAGPDKKEKRKSRGDSTSTSNKDNVAAAAASHTAKTTKSPSPKREKKEKN